MPQSVLALEGVVKRYGAALGVGPIDFAVNQGEFLSLLGPSGCGKTTTLQIIAGLLMPTAGRVTLAGRDITTLEPPHRDMGVVFQSYALFPHKTVFDNVAFGLRMRKVPRAEIETRVRQMLDIVGLPNVERRLPAQLSGGQRQRVALARALVIEPAVLLLDEPLSNLDAMLRKRMRQELRDLQRRLGITTIFVTHDQDEAFEMSDRVILLNLGRIEQMGPPDALYDRPASRFVAEFIGEANLIEGRVSAIHGDQVRLELAGGVAVSAVASGSGLNAGDRALALLRPERIDLSIAQPAGDAVEGRITKRVFSGESLSFDVETTSGMRLQVSKPSLPHYRNVVEGQKVWAALDGCRALPVDG